MELVILLSSVEWQLVRVHNIHHIDLVCVLCFALLKIVAVTGNQFHAILVALLHSRGQQNQTKVYEPGRAVALAQCVWPM